METCGVYSIGGQVQGVEVKTAPLASGAVSGPFPVGAVQSFILPWPASVNALYRSVGGRVRVSESARAWKAQALALLSCSRCFGVKWPLVGRLGVRIEAYPPNKRARDLDNLIKVTLDAGNGLLWADDAQIDDVRIIRCGVDPDKKGYIELTVSVLP
jgi:crossover junction endodeoxyribonuclease RusA